MSLVLQEAIDESDVFFILSPKSGAPLPAEAIHNPKVSSLLLDGASHDWGGIAQVEEHQFTCGMETAEYALPRLHLVLIRDLLTNVERFANGRWQTGTMPPDTTMITPSGMPSAGRWRDKDLKTGSFRSLEICIDTAFINRVLREEHAFEINYHFGTFDPQITRMMLTLRAELAAGCPGGRLFGEGITTALVAHLGESYAVRPAKDKKCVPGLGPSDLRKAQELIHDRLAEDLSLQEIAAVVNLSIFYFGRLFKQSTGQAPHQYVIGQRVEKAKSLLHSERLTIGEVAQAVGFYDQAHLVRHFKRIVGMTPGQFREGR